MAGSDQSWRLRDIQWRKLWARQDYANFLLTACLIVATIVVSVVAEPHIVPYVAWDARISYPLHSNTIPSWVAVFTPLIMLALTIAHGSITDAVSSAVYFFLDGVQSFVMGIFLTQTFKYIVGRLRPNFLARCQPDVPNGVTFSLQNITSGISDQFPCTGGDVVDGRLAFPSGHTSACFNLAVYASAYLIWVWHWRHQLPARRLTFREEFAADLLNVLAKTWMLGMICFAWGVGISRIIDYQHDVSDVLGGAFLGTMIAIVYILRAIPRWRRVLQDTSEGPRREFVSSGDVEAPIIPGDGAAKQRVVATSSQG
ncbi:hypothetical protein ABPG75_001311 [Micractinium tetrahymenae]